MKITEMRDIIMCLSLRVVIFHQDSQTAKF